MYSRYEQESSIVWDEDTKTARIYTASPVTMRKLDRLCAECPETYQRTWAEKTGDSITAAKYEMPARFIRFGKPATAAQIEAGKRAIVRLRSASETAR